MPNPTYDPVGVPGSLESYFRGKNQEGKEVRDLIEMQRIQPEYRDRAKRIAAMDAQGVDFAWLLPSLGLGLEEMLTDDAETGGRGLPQLQPMAGGGLGVRPRRSHPDRPASSRC